MHWISCVTWDEYLSHWGLPFFTQLPPSQDCSKPQRCLPVNGALAESCNVGGYYQEKVLVLQESEPRQKLIRSSGGTQLPSTPPPQCPPLKFDPRAYWEEGHPGLLPAPPWKPNLFPGGPTGVPWGEEQCLTWKCQDAPSLCPHRATFRTSQVPS